MGNTRLYVGINGIMICLRHKIGVNVSGCFYHLYSKDGVLFETLEQMIHQMEQLYNELRFPQPGNVDRVFRKVTEYKRTEGRMIKVMKDEELLNKHGDLGTFLSRFSIGRTTAGKGELLGWRRIRRFTSALFGRCSN